MERNNFENSFFRFAHAALNELRCYFLEKNKKPALLLSLLTKNYQSFLVLLKEIIFKTAFSASRACRTE